MLCLLVAALGLQLAASEYSECSPGTHRVISYNNTLVPPDGVQASSEDPTFNPDDKLFHRNNVPLRLWCSQSYEEAMREDSEMAAKLSQMDFNSSRGIFHINVDFTRPLLLTHIITSGFSNGYVNNFTFDYSLEDEGPFVPYQNSEGFLADEIDTVFKLHPPLGAHRLRFIIYDGIMTPSGRLCWHLTLLGCTLDEALNETVSSYTAPVDETTSHSISVECSTVTTAATDDGELIPETSTPSGAPMGSTEVGEEGVSSTASSSTSTASTALANDTAPTTAGTVSTASTTGTESSYELEIVIPISVALAVLTLCIVMAGLCLCVCFKCSLERWRRECNRLKARRTLGSCDTLGMVDNELYKSRSSVFPMSMHRVATLATDKNAASQAAHGAEAIYENCSRPVNNTYRESSFYDTVAPRNMEIEQSTKSVDSMVDNPTYSVPFPLSYHPLNTMEEEEEDHPAAAPKLFSIHSCPAGTNNIDMVDNMCYSVPSTYDPDCDMDWAERRRHQAAMNCSLHDPCDYEMPN